MRMALAETVEAHQLQGVLRPGAAIAPGDTAQRQREFSYIDSEERQILARRQAADGARIVLASSVAAAPHQLPPALAALESEVELLHVRLAEANALLFSLHRVAQTLPASLDLDDVLTSTVSRLRDLIDFDTAALLLRDEATSGWIVGKAEGVRPEHALRDEDLPPPLRASAAGAGSILIADLATDGPGLGQLSRYGLYSSLRARDSLVGLIAL